MKLLKFTARIAIIGVNPYVLLPDNVLQDLFAAAKKESGGIAVKGSLNGSKFKQTLVKYAGQWRLYLNGVMRKNAGVDVGDRVDITIMFDNTPRIIPMHPEFEKALHKSSKARIEFEKYPPSRQKEINRYLNTIKSDEVRQKNIEKVLGHLEGKDVGYFVLLRNKK